MDNRFIRFGLIYIAAIFVAAASPLAQDTNQGAVIDLKTNQDSGVPQVVSPAQGSVSDKQISPSNPSPTQVQLNNPATAAKPVNQEPSKAPIIENKLSIKSLLGDKSNALSASPQGQPLIQPNQAPSVQGGGQPNQPKVPNQPGVIPRQAGQIKPGNQGAPVAGAIRKSLMYQYSDYDKINKVHQALIARKRAVGSSPESQKGRDVLEGILSKLQTNDEKKVEVKDIPSIYLGSLIYTGPNTGMAWINNKKFNLGDDQEGIKLITVDKDSALIAWQVQNPNTDLSPIASMLSGANEESLDLTKSAQDQAPKKKKKNKSSEIIALDEKDRIVSLRLKPNQSFDTASLRLYEGKTAPRPAAPPAGAAKPPAPPSQNAAQNGLMPVGNANNLPAQNSSNPLSANNQPFNPARPANIQPNPNQPIQQQPPTSLQGQTPSRTPGDNIQAQPQVPVQPPVVNQNPPANPANTISNPPIKQNETIDIDSIINKNAPTPINPNAQIDKKLPDIKMENAPVANPSAQKKLPSIFDKNGESFYNRDLKPNLPNKDDSVEGPKLLQAPQEKTLEQPVNQVQEVIAPTITVNDAYTQTGKELSAIVDPVAKPIIDKVIKATDDVTITAGIKELRDKGKAPEAAKLEEYIKLGKELNKSTPVQPAVQTTTQPTISPTIKN